MSVRISAPAKNLREELAKGTDNTLDKAVWGDLTVNGNISSTGIDVTGTATADGLTVDGDAAFQNAGVTRMFWDASAESLTVSGAINGHDYRTVGALGYITYDSDNTGSGALKIRHGSGSEKMRIDSSGHVIVPNGITLGTAAGTYNAANTLDDYEEGTFTPTWNGGSVTVTYASYIKIGNLVLARLDITYGSSASSSTTYLTLPFTASGETVGSVAYTTAVVTNPTIIANASGIFHRDSVSGGQRLCSDVAGERYKMAVSYISV